MSEFVYAVVGSWLVWSVVVVPVNGFDGTFAVRGGGSLVVVVVVVAAPDCLGCWQWPLLSGGDGAVAGVAGETTSDQSGVAGIVS